MYKTIAAMLAFLTLLAGCGTAAAVESEPQDTVPAARTVLGKIKEINGNEILLALAEESPGGGPGPGDSDESGRPAQRPDADAPPQGEAPEQPEQESPSSDRPQREGGSGRGQGGAPAGGGFPNNDGSAGGAPSGDAGGGRSGNRSGGGQGPGNTQSVTLTGEEQTFLIPVTASVTTGQGDGARTVRFTQLAVKNVVRLNLDENDNIFSVEVLQ